MSPDLTIDYAVRQFVHKLFVPRPGIDRVGRTFSPDDIPADDDGRSSELARKAQSLFVEWLVSKGSNPSDDVYEVKTDIGRHCRVRMQWLRLYWRET